MRLGSAVRARAARSQAAQLVLTAALTSSVPMKDSYDRVRVQDLRRRRWAEHDRELLQEPLAGVRYRASTSPLGRRLEHSLVLDADPQRVLLSARWTPEAT